MASSQAKALQAADGGAAVLELLQQTDQLHLLNGWNPDNAAGIAKFIAQISALNKGYPGGLAGYKAKAQELLQASATGDNPFEGMTPEIPMGCKLHYGDEEFEKFEEGGLAILEHVGFVLVAGGLGERLGFNGIKVALPTEITTLKCYLQFYIETILACQRTASIRAGREVKLPFAIMLSGDTHARTQELLESNGYFGLEASQVTLMLQEKVASIIDNDGHFSPGADWEVETKPHGHGDVHYLMHSLGVAKRWRDEYKTQFAVFFQDTNALVFHAVIPALGVSAKEMYAVNSIAGPRQAKREMGAIIKLTRPDGTSITNNVEYNQLDAVLRDSGRYPDGDAPGEDGMSPFVGNMNQLIFHIPTYVEVLEKTQGLVPEFVNPKYADETRSKFKKPTRLECMMQDLPRLFQHDEKVGFTTLTGSGMRPAVVSRLVEAGIYSKALAAEVLETDINFYSPCKNNKADGAAKQKKGVHPSSACTGEADLYAANCRQLLSIGVTVHPPTKVTFGRSPEDIWIQDWPHVVLAPAQCLSTAHVSAVFPTPDKVEISSGATLVLEGAGKIVIESLKLTGALTIRCQDRDASITIRNAVVNNGGMRFEEVGDDAEEVFRIRGYRLDVKAHEVWESMEEGKVIDGAA